MIFAKATSQRSTIDREVRVVRIDTTIGILPIHDDIVRSNEAIA